MVKCVDCKSTTIEDKLCPRGEGARPKDCYNYTKNYEHDKKTGCWLSHCAEKSSDASNSVSKIIDDMDAFDIFAIKCKLC